MRPLQIQHIVVSSILCSLIVMKKPMAIPTFGLRMKPHIDVTSEFRVPDAFVAGPLVSQETPLSMWGPCLNRRYEVVLTWLHIGYTFFYPLLFDQSVYHVSVH